MNTIFWLKHGNTLFAAHHISIASFLFQVLLDRKQKEVIELTKICLEDFLNQDEEQIYNAILNKLKPGAKWTEQETNNYMELAFSNWSEDIEILEGDLDNYRKFLLKEITGIDSF